MNAQVEAKLDFPLGRTMKINKLKKRDSGEDLASKKGRSSESVLIEPLLDRKNSNVYRQELIYLAISYPHCAEL